MGPLAFNSPYGSRVGTFQSFSPQNSLGVLSEGVARSVPLGEKLTPLRNIQGNSGVAGHDATISHVSVRQSRWRGLRLNGSPVISQAPSGENRTGYPQFVNAG